MSAPTCKRQTIWGWPHGCKKKKWFSVGSRIVNPYFDLTINVIDHLIFGKSCMHENRFENLWLKFYDDISCELHTCMYRRWYYESTPFEYITPRKDVLGVHGSSEGCSWIHSFSEGCVWNRFENLWLKFFLWWHLIWTPCLYVTQVRGWKYVLGVHGSLEGCTGCT